MCPQNEAWIIWRQPERPWINPSLNKVQPHHLHLCQLTNLTANSDFIAVPPSVFQLTIIFRARYITLLFTFELVTGLANQNVLKSFIQPVPFEVSGQKLKTPYTISVNNIMHRCYSVMVWFFNQKWMVTNVKKGLSFLLPHVTELIAEDKLDC